MEEGNRINKSLLTLAVANQCGVRPEEVEVEAIDIAGGSQAGENYLSVLKAVDAKAKVRGGSSQLFHYMIKTFPMSQTQIHLVKEVTSIELSTSLFISSFLSYVEQPVQRRD